MTLDEFKEEFKFKYDAASKGAPDMDDYEISLMLTAAVKDVIALGVASYESNESSRRLLNNLLKYHNSVITVDTTQELSFIVNSVSLPTETIAVLRETAKLLNCTDYPEVVISSIDEVSNMLNNPFKRPTKRKVLRIEKDKVSFLVYSSAKLESYKITYVGKIKPIVISDLGYGLSIEGSTKKTETELPSYIHSNIIDIAVDKAIRVTRSNSAGTKK